MFTALTDSLRQLPMIAPQTVGIWIAALLTLAVLSFILGNNPIFRFAQYLFVGVAAGYAAAIVWTQAILPRLVLLLTNPQTYWYYGLFFGLGLLLLTRGIRPISALANIPLGVLVGVGAALALGGAITGSLIPQMSASVVSLAPADYGSGLLGWALVIDAFLVLVGTIAALSAFHFTVRRQGGVTMAGPWLQRVLSGVGRKLILVAFGAFLAGAALSFFAVLQSRIHFLVYDWIQSFLNLGL